MRDIKFCIDCKHSKEGIHSSWELRCINPILNRKDPSALASGGTSTGSSAVLERSKKWLFGECGMRGALWEKKDD